MSRGMTIALKQLSECPEHVTSVGLWIYEEWWRKRCDSPEDVFSWLRTHSKLDTVPYSVIALAEDEPVGSCCVIENDCIHRRQYAPWVAAVYVKPDFRRRGIASRILHVTGDVAQSGFQFSNLERRFQISDFRLRIADRGLRIAERLR